MRPKDIGFDERHWYYSAQNEISQTRDSQRYLDRVLDAEKLAAFKAVAPNDHLIHEFKGGQTSQVGQIQSTEDIGCADAVLARFTVDKITRLSARDKPFFIEHCFRKVHANNFVNPDYEGLSASKYPGQDAIGEVDLHVGQFMQALEDARVLENTFVFFTSDNGPQMDA